jgi:hypothetical protein
MDGDVPVSSRRQAGQQQKDQQGDEWAKNSLYDRCSSPAMRDNSV